MRTCGLISKRFILTTWRNLKNLVVNQLCKVCLLSFYLQDRPYSYEIADVSEINVMLNNNDVSDYLKISPTGLEVRNPMDWYITYNWLVQQVEHFIVHEHTVAIRVWHVSDKVILKLNCSLWYISGRKECFCPLFQNPRIELKIHVHYLTCILTHFKHCLECVIYPLNRKHVLLYQIITWHNLCIQTVSGQETSDVWWINDEFVNNLEQIICYFRQGVMHPHLKAYVAHFVSLQVSIISCIWNHQRHCVTVFNNSLEMAEQRQARVGFSDVLLV